MRTPISNARTRPPLRVTVTAALVALCLAACGRDVPTPAGPTPTSTVAPTTTTTLAPTTTRALDQRTTTTRERPTEPIDERIAIDGGRLHIRCVGTGTTTVVLIAGWGGGDDGWGAIEPALAERARVCSYARFGSGTSDPPVTTQTFATQAVDLHELLRAAAEPGPYVMVGHSFGGAQAVTFASLYSDEVAGLVLLDASPVTWPAAVCGVPAYEAGCAVMRSPALHPERLDVFAAFDEVATISSLGQLPMTVITATHRTDPGLSPDVLSRLDATWADGVERWAALSPRSTTVLVEDTSHDIQDDQPGIVTAEIIELLP